MKELTFAEQFKIYVQSGFPIIGIHTREVDRVTGQLAFLTEAMNQSLRSPKLQLAADKMFLKTQGLRFYTWDVYNGWQLRGKGNQPFPGTAKTPEAACTFMINDKSSAGIFVLQNLHLFFPEKLKWPQRLQLLREVYSHGRKNHKYLFLVGDLSEIPPDLSPYMVMIDFNLPDKEEISVYLEKYLKDAGSGRFRKEEIVGAAGAAVGMTLMEVESAVCVSLVGSKGKKIDTEVIFREKAKAVKKSGLLEYMPSTVHLKDDVGDLGNLKEWSRRVGKVFLNREKALADNVAIPKGCMVMGIAGTGKSLFAKCVANEFGIPLFRLDIGKLFGGIVGQTERQTRDFIQLAEAMAPCVLFVDEIEKALAGLGSSDRSDSGVTARLIGSFLNWMQDKTSAVYVIATANNVDALPPEMLRKGRFDEMWFVDLPSAKSRAEIFKIHLRKREKDMKKFGDAKIRALANVAKGFTGAEIENAIDQAKFHAFYEDRKVTPADIQKAIRATVPLIRTKPKEIAELRAWAADKARPANKESYDDDSDQETPPKRRRKKGGDDLLEDKTANLMFGED